MSKQPFVVKQGEGEVLRCLGSEVKFICSGDQTSNAWSLMECAAPRDMGPPAHHHAWDEAYYITAGEVRFTLDDRDHLAKVGEFVYIPAGVKHAFRGASDEAARMLIFSAPCHADDFFRDVEREVREMPRDLAQVPVIGERHGIHFARPE
jgi:quercetin dioxygenase-like cupin family protein